MPFEIAPHSPPPRVGRFQEFADAMLRGCAITKPAPGLHAVCSDHTGKVTHTCALFALRLGGVDVQTEGYIEMSRSYRHVYGASYIEHYICGAATREQIAQRIAAL